MLEYNRIKKVQRKNTGLDSFLCEFGDRLRDIIDNHLKITHKEFSINIRVSRSYLSGILSGKKEFSIEFLQNICKNYPNLNTRYLILGIGPVFINSACFDTVYEDYVSIFSKDEIFLKWVLLLSRSEIFKFDIMSHLAKIVARNQADILSEFKLRKIDDSIIPHLF